MKKNIHKKEIKQNKKTKSIGGKKFSASKKAASINAGKVSSKNKHLIRSTVSKVTEQYGDTLKRLARE